MEGLLATIDLDRPDDERADAYRRQGRLTRALRLVRETRERCATVHGFRDEIAVSADEGRAVRPYELERG
jgi:hypothetical protein